MNDRFDRQMMASAVKLANCGLYTTHPNPRVGCIITQGEQIVGEGWHKKAGGPHAEIHALQVAGECARGATAYVTLEPCSHFGKTPPCADALVKAGVVRVVAAMVDPNPLVAGNGLKRLEAAGIETGVGLLQAEAEALNPGFIKRMRSGRPFVRIKLAMSLDGRTAMASGESQWITSAEARADVHRLRARSDAILTGIGTVKADDPSMNVRLAKSDLAQLEQPDQLPQPLRVVLDSKLEIDPEAQLFTLPGRVLVVGSRSNPAKVEALKVKGAEPHILPELQGRVDLNALLELLARQEVNEVLLEAGPTLAGAALQAGVVDEMVLYIAPHLMGSAARGLFNLPGLEKMADRVELEITDLRQIGRDVRVTVRPGSPL